MALAGLAPLPCAAQQVPPLSELLIAEGSAALAADARLHGNPRRGALVYFDARFSCRKCHEAPIGTRPLGPDLAPSKPLRRDPTGRDSRLTTEQIVEAVLEPSKKIREGYETFTFELNDGQVVTGTLVEDTPDTVIIREVAQPDRDRTIPRSQIAARDKSMLSLMPEGQINLLTDRQQFLDLARYLFEIYAGGPDRAAQLEPPAYLYAQPPLPEYEARLDHAELVRSLDDAALFRGAAIYERACANCHGTSEREGTLPSAPRFAIGRLKQPTDPLAMYRTLTHGFGLMAAQSWMVPRQKYDVIHYIRETFLSRRADKYVAVDNAYLAALPAGDTLGPQPPAVDPWVAMDYGPYLIGTYAIGTKGQTFAHKGIAMRLDPGEGGIARGRQWVLFDHDTLRWAGGWSGRGFIDWRGILFNGEHGVHPRTIGRASFVNHTGPGWANPADGGWDDARVLGRDGQRYGPLPASWAKFRGLFRRGDSVILSYTVGETDVLEAASTIEHPAGGQAWVRRVSLGRRTRELNLLVGQHPTGDATLVPIEAAQGTIAARLALADDPSPRDLIVSASASGAGLTWVNGPSGAACLAIPAGQEPLELVVTIQPGGLGSETAAAASTSSRSPDLRALVGQSCDDPWPDPVVTHVVRGHDHGPLAIDELVLPRENPWNCQVRPTGLDFLADGRIAVCTWDGDVWLVSETEGDRLEWKRIASGLFQPLGLLAIDGAIHVTCRDQIVILRDSNADGATDFYECFNSDHQVTEHFHEFAMGLARDDAGNLYYAKSARHALPAIVPHHGTLLQVSPDGKETRVVATGFRAANGVCLNPDGTFFVTDQEGHWIPKNRINWVRTGGFYGNMFGYHDVTDTSDVAMRQPVCWITQGLDRSPAELLWVDSDRFGELAGSLLSLSYGYGKIFVVPHERVGDKLQGGVVELPLFDFPTGLIRGRFSRRDGQLYVCGMYAWAGSVTQPGGLYRVRYTGRPLYVPKAVAARRGELSFEFSGSLDAASTGDMAAFHVRTWTLRRTAEYGSEHFDERELTLAAAELSDDGRTLRLNLPELAPVQCISVEYHIRAADGEPVDGLWPGTIHALGP